MKSAILILLLMLLINKTFARAFGGKYGRSANIDLSRYKESRKLVGTPDEMVGKLVKNWKKNGSNGNPEELGNYLEGDILIPRSATRNGLIGSSYYWDNGIIPFEVVGDFDDENMAMIEEAMDAFHNHTCIQFVPKDNTHEDYISIRDTDSGCWSSIGRLGTGMQKVNLQKDGCLWYVGSAIHEFMHTLGFHHEQSREDRDDYIEILYKNVKQGMEKNFDKAKPGTTTAFHVMYDYRSVMHYSATAFSKNKRPTIRAKIRFRGKMGQRDGFSAGDIKKIRSMYGCTATTSSTGYKVKLVLTPPRLDIVDSRTKKS